MPLLEGKGTHSSKPPVSEPGRERHGAAKWDQRPEGMAGLYSSASRARSVEAEGQGTAPPPAPFLAWDSSLPILAVAEGYVAGRGLPPVRSFGGLLNLVGATGAAWADMRPTGRKGMYLGIWESMVGGDDRGGLCKLS